MFVNGLDKNQQSALLYLSHEVAKADGDLHELQMGLMEVIKAQCEDNVQEQEVTLDELSQVFDNNSAKCSLLLELLGVAHSNNDYDPREKALIGQYAEALSISKNKLKELETWVTKQLALMEEVKQLIN